jgi:hypothetical protein
MINLICEVCGNEFQRRPAEVNRSKKNSRKIYCSLSCAGKANADNFGDKRNKDVSKLKKGHELDEFSAFRCLFNSCKRHSQSRSDKREFSITLTDLKIQWDKQKGLCPFTGWNLFILPTTNRRFSIPTRPDQASLDRIDSSKGYVKGNVQFVSLIAQYAKNGWDGEEVVKFCRAVVENDATRS